MSKSKAGSPGVEHTTQSFLEALAAGGGPPMETMEPADARKVLEGAQEGTTPPACDVTEKTIQVDGDDVTLTVVRPKGASGMLPAFMFFHGGGWVIGDYPTHQRFIHDLVTYSGCVAVYVDYARSPEARFPMALNQCYGATKWVAANGAAIQVDGSKLAVAGNSAGGNLAAATALKAKAEGGPKLAFQLLFWPVTDANFETESYNQFAEGHFLTKKMMIWFWDHYLPDKAARKDIYAAPLQALPDQLKGLPPTLIQTAQMDVLRDEGNAYGVKLDEAGVEVTIAQYNGLIHDYGLLNGLSEIPAVQAALRQGAAELARHLK
ncbi:MAG: esterase [Candidatus Hydrogenedentota bacterium]